MKIKLAVLFGGKSVEHEISVISAIQAIAALDTDKYDVIPVYITKNNEFYVGDGISDIESYKNIPLLLKKSKRCILVNEGKKNLIVRYPLKPFAQNTLYQVDIAFPIVHGTNVEDGTISGYLKMLNIPFVGCDVLSAAVGMDKHVMKAVLKDNGIPVLDCCMFTQKDYSDESAVIKATEKKFAYPVIVKPINLGSSVGISKAYDAQGLSGALENAFAFSNKVLVEPSIEDLIEINCAVLGSHEDAQASVCEHPLSGDEILSYQDKYITKGSSKGMASTKRIIPADIPHEQTETIRKMAIDAFRCLGCNGVARIDFMIDNAKNIVYLNEINTIPGSLSFYLWEPLDVPYGELLDKMIKLALDRQRSIESISFSFDTNILSLDRPSGKGKS